MIESLAGKRILVLSDNDGLARAIELSLGKRLGAEVIVLATLRVPHQGEPQETIGDCDLIVVATSSPTSEPVVALARASLAQRIGRVPLLIISDRPFHSEPDDQIVHLDFPFDLDTFYERVTEIFGPEIELEHSVHQGA